MKFYKRALSIFLVWCLMLTMLPVQALVADRPEELEQREKSPYQERATHKVVTPYAARLRETVYQLENGAELRFDTSSGTVTRCIPNKQTDIEIPSEIEGTPVTAIGQSAFLGCGRVVSVTLPDSITSIGKYAFENCEKLVRVNIPSAVTEIPSGAFSGCGALSNITIPSGVTHIGDFAFYWTGLTSITLPSGITSIENFAFAVSRITSITIPDTVTSIGEYAFYDCEQLTNVITSANKGRKDVGAGKRQKHGRTCVEAYA